MTSPRILIIDPDAASLNFLRQSFSQDGFQTIGASSAKEGLIAAWRDRPHVLLIDPAVSDMPVSELIGKLRNDPRTAQRIYIAFSSLGDPSAIQPILELGFDEYFPKEQDALPNLKNMIGEMLSRSAALAQDSVPRSAEQAMPHAAAKEGRMIVVLSAKGGTGTSSICANVAQMLAHRQPNKTVALVDLVLPIGSIHSMVNYSGPINIVPVSHMKATETGIAYFQKNLPRIPRWNFYLLAGPQDPHESAELNVASVPVILKTMKAAFDLVIVDIGRSLSRIAMPIILSADQVMLITSVDKATVDLTETVWNYLREQGLQPRQMYALINRAVGHEGLSKPEVEDRLNLDIQMVIPYTNVNFTMANNQYVPYADKFPDDAATLSLMQAANDLRDKLSAMEGSFPAL